MAEERPLYRCTMLELYSTSDLICDNLTGDLALFTAFKSKYVAAYVTARRAQIQDCRDMPDDDARTYNSKQARIELGAVKEFCLANFQDLKSYIDDWRKTKEEQEAAYIAAGQHLYQGASDDNWEVMQGLNSTMSTFVNTNDALLQAEGYMPATFPGKLETDRDTFTNKYNAFKLARETGPATAAKVIANNELYLEMTKILEDAQRVFRNDAEKQKQYTWKELLMIVSPPGAASLTTKLKRDVDFTPIAGATIKAQREGHPVIIKETDANGVCEMDGMDAGVYTITVMIAGEPNRTFTKEVNVGVNARLELVIPKV